MISFRFVDVILDSRRSDEGFRDGVSILDGYVEVADFGAEDVEIRYRTRVLWL